MRSFAQIISIIFSPLTFIPLLIVFEISQVIDPNQRAGVTGIVFGLGVLPIIVSLFILKMTGRVSDWGIAKRKERHELGLIGMICESITTLLLHYYNFSALGNFVFLLLVGNIIFSAVTLFWKISAHTTAVTFFALMISKGSPANFYFLWTLVPLVFWARIHLRKHTPMQAVAGILLALGLFWIAKQTGVL